MTSREHVLCARGPASQSVINLLTGFFLFDCALMCEIIFKMKYVPTRL